MILSNEIKKKPFDVLLIFANLSAVALSNVPDWSTTSVIMNVITAIYN